MHRDIIGFNEKGSLEKPPVRSSQYCYDADGRLTAQQSHTAGLHFGYNSLGQLDSATRTPTAAGMGLGLGIHNLRFEYDKLGRLIHEAGENGGLNWAWDGLSNLQSLSLPQGQQVGYQRYGSGHVHGMVFDGVDILNFERDDLHREVLRTQGRLTSQRAYDQRGRVSRQRAIMRTAGESEKILIGRDYHYNPAGELERINDNVRGESQYDYDPAGRLTGYYQTRNNSASEHFAWDAADNLLSRGGQREALATPAIQGNRLLHTLFARAGINTPLSFKYDAFGRVVVKNPGNPHKAQHLVWDDEDQLVQVTDHNGTTRFAYDPLGRRIAKQFEPKRHQSHLPQTVYTTRFVWEGLRLVQEIKDPSTPLESGSIRTWVYDPAQPAGYVPLACIDQAVFADGELGAAKVHYAHTDQLGTILELTDAEGNNTWSANYSAWGKWLGSADVAQEHKAHGQTGCNLRFQGQYWDEETGLHYNTFRYYDPEIGRFISPDPIGVQGGFNLYAYVPNPTGWIDPWGLDELYALLAKQDGWYDVFEYGKKQPVGQMYLKEGELWKIGETKNPNTRYSKNWLARNKLEYQAFHTNTSKATNLALEKIKLKGHAAAKGGRLPLGNKCTH